MLARCRGETPFHLAHMQPHRQAFCRATRYWATYAETAAQHARQASPSATGYKLSDTELLPIIKPRESQVVRDIGQLGASYPCTIAAALLWPLLHS